MKLSDLLGDLLPQGVRFEHFGFGAKAQNPGFEFFGCAEFKLGDHGAVGLRGQLLRGVPALLLDVPSHVGGEANSHANVLARFAAIDAERAS